MKTIITNDIKKRMLNTLGQRAELNITEDEFLFKLNMDLYPHLRDHLMIENNTEEDNIKVKYMSLEEAKKDLLDDYSFGYQFWAYNDYLELETWISEIIDELANDENNSEINNSATEEEYTKFWKVIESEEKALHAELEAQLKKVIKYNADVKWFLEDLEAVEDITKEFSELNDIYEEEKEEAENFRQAELVVHQIKNIQKFVADNKEGTFKIAVDAIKELSNDENFKAMAAWGAGK